MCEAEYSDKIQRSFTKSLNFKFHYINDVLSLNNSRFDDLVDRIYPIRIELKETTNTDRSTSYLDLHLEIDCEERLRMKLYDRRDDFNFPILNFPLICSKIFQQQLHMKYISVDMIVQSLWFLS